MNRDDYKKFSVYRDLSTNKPEESFDPEYIMPDSELDRVIREIFSVDPRTGVPMGDLSYYLSPDGNPTVKQWLENNLLKPRVERGEDPEGLTDDLIVEFSRGADESLQSYQSRLMDIYDAALVEQQKVLDETE